MAAGPTNKRIAIVPLDLDTETAVRAMCAGEGCTCGDRLTMEVVTLTEEEARANEAAGAPAGAKHSSVTIHHADECPLLMRTRRN